MMFNLISRARAGISSLTVPVTLTLVAGWIVTALFFVSMQRFESQRLAADLSQRAAVRIAAISLSLARVEEALRIVTGERQLSWPVDDNYLGRFVT